jgi:hypothetical protein
LDNNIFPIIENKNEYQKKYDNDRKMYKIPNLTRQITKTYIDYNENDNENNNSENDNENNNSENENENNNSENDNDENDNDNLEISKHNITKNENYNNYINDFVLSIVRDCSTNSSCH